MVIQVTVKETGKNSTKDNYEIFSSYVKSFNSLPDVMKWLKETYGNKKRNAMYVDDKDGNPKKVGWMIGYWNQDMSHPYRDDGKPNKWLQQDWIEVVNVDYSRLKLK